MSSTDPTSRAELLPLSTGVEAVDEALAPLAGIEDRPLAEQSELLAQVHAALHGSLDDAAADSLPR